jgi:hypothetical protein
MNLSRSGFVLSALFTLSACHSVSGVVDDGDGDGVGFTEDCDDWDASVYPGADEICDGLDNDCDGDVDEDAVDALSWAVDFDGDGFGDTEAAVRSCDPVEGMVEDATDCDDSDAEVNPAAEEIWYDGVDGDCDGASDYDQDGDGHDSDAYEGDDCDDLDPAVSPSADEVWYDGVDGDCDGADDYDQDGDGWREDVDCDDTDPEVFPGAEEIWYDGVDGDCDGASDYDQDGDGYDSDAYGGDDCDDLDPGINPGIADRWYDGVDGDCDGASDYDQDGDGYDSDAYGGDDCDDLDPATFPGAEEIWYDGVDGDCDGADDYDQDGDGWRNGVDCDDTDAAVSPDATEVWYDGVDGDCDGASDYDQDGDGYDSDTHGGTDCDDLDGATSPGADELCDEADNDCDGVIDEDDAADAPTWYLDWDGDGYGDGDVGSTACDQPSGTVADGTDCDDRDASLNHDDIDADGYSSCDGDCDDDEPSTNPGAEDLADDGIDNDCDGEVDNLSETWVITTAEDFMLGGIDGNAHLSSHDDGELQLAWAATGFSSSAATESLPSACSSMGVVAANGYLYSVGGSVGSSYSTDVASAYINSDGSLDPWDDSLEELPTGTTTVALATDGHCLVMAGGYTSSDSTAEEVYTAELYGDGTIAPWVAQQSLSSGRGYAAAAVVRGFVYVIGGQSSSGSSSAVYYAQLEPDCSIDSWSSTTSLPSSRYSHAVTVAGDNIYVVGGRSSYSASSAVYRATPSTNGTISSWSTESSMPDALYQLGAVAVDGYLIAGGGYDGYYIHDTTYYAEIEDDGSLGSWSTGTANLSGDRRYFALVAWDGTMYQVGGRSDRSSYSATRSDTVQQFEFTESAVSSAYQTGFYYVFDLAADLDVLGLDWASTSVSDGTVSVHYRVRTDAGTAGSWTSAGSSPPLSLSATARYVEVWVELSSVTGDGSTLDEISLEYRD